MTQAQDLRPVYRRCTEGGTVRCARQTSLISEAFATAANAGNWQDEIPYNPVLVEAIRDAFAFDAEHDAFIDSIRHDPYSEDLRP